MKSLKLESWFLLAFGLFTAFWGLDSFSIYILDEAKNAEAAREMWENASWFFPTFNGEPRYDKPPLHYFFFGIAYKVLGVNAFAARFFPALAGWVCGLLIFFRVRERFGEKEAGWAYVGLIASLQWGIQFRLAVPDPFLILFLTACILKLEAFFHDEQHPKKHLRLASVFLALAFLSKGPVALVLVAGTGLGYLLLQRKSPQSLWKRMLDPMSVLIFCGIALPWYFLVYYHYGGEWLSQFVFKHNISRFSQPMEGHGGPFYLPFLFALAGFFPASLLLFLPWKNRFRNLRSRPLLLISLIYIGITVCFFSISSTKLPGYIAPAFPFMAVLFGWQIKGINRLKGIFLTNLLIGIILVAFPFVIFFTSDLQLVYLGEELSVSHFALLLVFVLGAFLWRQKPGFSFLFLGVGFGLFKVMLISQVLPLLDQQNPVVLSMPFLEKTEEVVYWKSFNPAFPFHLQKTIPAWVPDENRDAIIITDAKHLESFPVPYQEIFRAKDTFENKETVLIRQMPVLP
ncbi:glycosyltransferase family 39 protein [Algoriphagus halophytocola]|uniref:ArnT family glycosyltransferase n=1 Tax=Algoriphagus halophytocola TaxID=2991499 RepID=UPI0022DD4999|nr:glycosyltransferase family 39 protein [Algoriphagus sp. TR-M9]WBL43574.1 glycosyltransferase family 39 protein [Algoriphagus sp. TR-M9]